MAKRDDSVNCWPNGHAGSPCDAKIPKTDHETMTRYGWGFAYGFDPAMPDGVPGAFYACPEHRDDCTQHEREGFRLKYAVTPEGKKIYE